MGNETHGKEKLVYQVLLNSATILFIIYFLLLLNNIWFYGYNLTDAVKLFLLLFFRTFMCQVNTDPMISQVSGKVSFHHVEVYYVIFIRTLSRETHTYV